ncbi:FkbM family methyltransferase [Sulfurospirillum multivorans]|uniref:Glycosyltransferase / methyltransferase n=2 Tax=Sulfurospirillum multivorans TaxID=66821 RepID=A0AA86ARF1_SULMK|nr:FkbM family methyltransferase [Sulfurospirillum multivorans]AHJ14411.1 glycosyltransferase / methyltransferase [Sulfurospirillum multivorans DSM 12446]
MMLGVNFPKITIVTVTYNAEQYLEQTIQSLLSQDYPNLEYIIIDGGSTDRTVDIIKHYEANLMYWISEPDGGMYHALQKGFEKATGDIMAWLNADDMYHAKALFNIANIFTALPTVQWLTGMNTLFDEQGRTVLVRRPHQRSWYDMFLTPQLHIQQESTFWRRELWEKAGGKVDTSLKYAGDFELWLRFFKHTRLFEVDTLIGGFRVREGQLSRLHQQEYGDECEYALQREREKLSFFDQCHLKTMQKIKLEIQNQGLTKDSIEKKEISIREIAQYPFKIIFDFQKKEFVLQGEIMSQIDELQHRMKTNHKNLGEYLHYLKNDHLFYPEVVVDVGVAFGTGEIYEVFPESTIVLVEPLEECSHYLDAIANRYEDVHIYKVAAAKKSQKLSFFVHPDLVGSSLYQESEGDVTDGECREVDAERLDVLCAEHVTGSRKVFLKIDVQGAELDVLAGYEKLLKNTEVIVLEVSLHPFFKHGPQLHEVIAYMHTKGYVVHGIFGFLHRPLDGALAQVDVAFVKQNGQFRQFSQFATSDQRGLLNQVMCSSKNNHHQFASNYSKIAFQQNFNALIHHIQELGALNASYLIYGHGAVGRTIQALIPDKIVAFIDQKSNELAKEIKKGGVYNPSNLSNIPFDKIIISVLGREEEIEHYLTQTLHVNQEKIIRLSV